MSMIIRLPNWLGDVVMSLPIIRALAAKQPQLILSGQAAFAPLIAALGFSQPYQTLPAKNWHYYAHFLRQRGQFEQALLFTHSQRSDLEAWLLGAKRRYGIAWRERPRRLLNQRYLIEHPEQEGQRHQSQLLADFTAHFGLQDGVSFAPLLPPLERKAQIVLICGSENNPEKRWVVEKWQQLINALRQQTTAEILLCGTAKDRLICEQILQPLAVEKVQNLAGTTSMLEFFSLLRQAQCVIGNDTGGLHLANAAATPTIGLYAPTNPLRSRPIFAAPLQIVQPPNCPASGGGNMADIAVEQVLQAWQQMNALV